MIRPLSTSLLLIGALGALATDADAQRRRRRPRPEVKLEHLTYAEKSFESKALDRETKYGVFLPKGYDDEKNADRKYPLIVWLHGMWEDHNRFQYRGGAPVLDKLVGDGALPECVFVTANGSRSSFYINGKKTGKYEDLIAKDLIQHIDATYRVEEDRAQRALMGVSMGGFGALKIALRYPKLFGVVAAHSAALLPADSENLPSNLRRAEPLVAQIFGRPTDTELWRRENVLAMAEGLEPEALMGLKVYFDCGSEDRFGFGDTNGVLHSTLTERKIKHTWRLVDGGRHGSEYVASQLPQSLGFVGKAWTAGRGTAGLGGLLGGNGGSEPKEPSKGKDR